jgi:transcriptional regulator with XRE-family HTH domain
MRGREIIGLNVRRLRVERDVSQERLAFDSGVDRSYLSGVERGEENPTIDVLDKLAGTLLVHVSALLEVIDENESSISGLKRGRKPNP